MWQKKKKKPIIVFQNNVVITPTSGFDAKRKGFLHFTSTIIKFPRPVRSPRFLLSSNTIQFIYFSFF